MSLFLGVINRNSQLIPKNGLDSLHDAVKDIPHKSYKEIIHKQAAFGCLHTNDDGMPVYLEEQALLFVAQGRVDNKVELIALLDSDKNINEKISDEKLMLHVFLKFKEETPNKIVGDWSIASYDFKKNRLFLAQDPCGYTSLYFYIDSDIVIFSNLIKPLLASKKVPKEIDLQQIIARAAIISGLEKDATFYKAIKRLNPAHYMWVNNKTYHKERYWFPERLPLNYDISAEDAAVKLKEIFIEAIRCRLRSNKPIASMLSGGLDSGSVTTIAANILKEQQTELHTFSHIPLFDVNYETISKHKFGDERPYIEATIKHNGNITPHYIDSKKVAPLQGIHMILDILDAPIHAAANAFWIVDLINQAKQLKFGVLLSGEMGNATISWRGSQRHLLNRHSFKLMLKNKLLRPVYSYIKSFYKKIFHRDAWQNYSYLHPEFAKKVSLNCLIEKSGRNVDFSSNHTYKELQQRIHKFGFNPRCNFGSAFSHYFGLEMRDPTGDKRVVEFMLQLPNELFFSETGENKQLLKLMMKGLLPDKVLFQKKKGLQSADIIERVQPDLPDIKSIITSFSTDICEIELFDKKRMLHDLQKLQEKKLSVALTTHLLRSIEIMEFLNRNKNGSSTMI